MTTPLLFAAIASIAAGPIIIDGDFRDWRDVPVAVEDPADAPDAPIDFGELRLTHDAEHVHLLIDLARPVNVQRLGGTIEILFDTDADGGTGQDVDGMPGVDFVVELSPIDPAHPDRGGRGAGIAVPTDQPPPGDRLRLSPYLVGLTFAPTYASDEFELRMERGAALPGIKALLGSGTFRVRLVYLDRNGSVIDDTAAVAYDLRPVAPAPPDRATDPLARPAGAQLRVMTWNTSLDGLRLRPEPFRRILHALDPDVVLLEELTARDDPQELEAWLGAWIGAPAGERWTAMRGIGGGRLRCAVASRRPLTPYPAFDPLPMPDRPDLSIRVIGAEVPVQRRRLLVAGTHLMCCGQAGSFEDRTRIVEADAIRRELAAATASGRFNGLMVAGDLNMVGSRWPLDVLAENLHVVDALQLDGTSNITWSDDGQPYLPGRLDFVIVSGRWPTVLRSFVLDTAKLQPRWLKQHGLEIGDTAEASDHMPVVVDLR